MTKTGGGLAARQGLRARIARSLGFTKREMIGFGRQPRLLVTLILSPFAILLIFGLGYRTEAPPFETLLVLQGEESALVTEQEDLSQAFGKAIDLKGTTTDASQARARLRSGDVDLLIIGPVNAIGSLNEGKRAEFVVVHSEVDPVIRASITLLAQLSVDELNKRILAGVVSDARAGSQLVEQPLADARSSGSDLVSALETGDTEAEEIAGEDLVEHIDDLEAALASSTALNSVVGGALGVRGNEIFASLRAQLDEATRGDDVDAARELEARLTELDEQLDQLRDIDSDLLVSPFAADVQDIADLPGTPALFYAPGTLVVLMQHLALTFAALSLVRERQLGLTEVFKASPLAPREILIGKFVAFMLVATSIAALLTGVMFGFGVTMRGSWWHLGLVLVLVIATSLGLGFVISGLAQTDSQAVQYAMMVLLASIFFTGLILPMEQLIPPVRVVSYLLPGTYGIRALHDVMFRGLRPEPLLIAGLIVYFLAATVASWWVMKKHVRGVAA